MRMMCFLLSAFFLSCYLDSFTLLGFPGKLACDKSFPGWKPKVSRVEKETYPG